MSAFIACLLTALCMFLPVLVYWCAVYFKFKSSFSGKVPNIPILPIIGSAHILKNPKELYKKLLQYREEKGRFIWFMLGFEPIIPVMDAKLAEIILSSTTIMDKSPSYGFLYNWLGTGLLTSTGEKWRKHRKILTPTFHFKILEDFIPSFDNASDILVDALKNEVGKDWTDIFPYISLCTLDSICESAMGTPVNAQQNKHSPYVLAVKEMCRIIMDRTISAMGQFEFTYRLTKDHKLEQKYLKVLHNYTDAVIKRRKKELACEIENDTEDDVGMKKRKAFLDLLLEYSRQGSGMTDKDIREEVDTFMFEGHDTTAAAISFCLYLLSKNRPCQEKVFAEVKEIFADDRTRKATFKDLQEMKYLDLVLKETLRFFPSVPIFARRLNEDLMYGDVLIPKGATLGICPYIMQLDPEYFPEPHLFRPERFLAENLTDRKSNFSYVPFSAGPRNCIGQKFAMLSMKSTISKVIKNYDFYAVDYEMELSSETVLRSRNGVKVHIKERRWYK